MSNDTSEFSNLIGGQPAQPDKAEFAKLVSNLTDAREKLGTATNVFMQAVESFATLPTAHHFTIMQRRATALQDADERHNTIRGRLVAMRIPADETA